MKGTPLQFVDHARAEQGTFVKGVPSGHHVHIGVKELALQAGRQPVVRRNAT